jgi:L-aspartate oxidase
VTHHVERLRSGRLERLEDAEKVRSSLRRIMWGQVGLIRSRESLVRATAQLARWEQMVSQSFPGRADLEVKNMVQVAHCVAEAALWRENSVGAHYRSDFPGSKRPGWKQHSQLYLGGRTTGLTEPKTRGRVVALRTPKRG